MPASLRNATVYVLLSAFSGVVAFFLFAAAFNEPNWQFAKTASLIFGLIFLVSAAFGFLLPKRWLRVAIALALPIEFVAFVFGVQVAMEGKNVIGWISIGLSGLIVPALGSWVGQFAKTKRGRSLPKS